MAKEIKNFKVWHPPPDQWPQDEPLVALPPESDFLPRWYRRPQLTLTGWFWLIAPWGLLLAKRLSFSLVEFWIWIVAWSMSAGAIFSGLKPGDASWRTYALLFYAAFHVHCLLFSAIVYELRGTKGRITRWRTVRIMIPQFLVAGAAVGFTLLGRLN